MAPFNVELPCKFEYYSMMEWPVEASQSCNSVRSNIQLTVMTQDYNLCVCVTECIHVTTSCLCNVINHTPLYHPHLSYNAQFYRELTQVFIGLCNESTLAPCCSHKIILFGLMLKKHFCQFGFRAAILKSVVLAFS